MSVESRTMEMVGLLNDTLSWLDMYLSVVSSTMLIGVISDLWHYCHIKMKSITQQIPLGYYSFTENWPAALPDFLTGLPVAAFLTVNLSALPLHFNDSFQYIFSMCVSLS